MMITIYSLVIGLLIVAIPFIISIILITKLIKEKDKSISLEERVKVLEAEIKNIKDYMNMIDEL